MREVKSWNFSIIKIFVKGKTKNSQCYFFSFLLIPGIQMLPDSVLAIIYLIIIIYVFIGVYLAMDSLIE